MSTFQASGRRGLTKVFTAVASPGTLVSFPVPVKTFIIMPSGGNITFRFNLSDADADAFPIENGQSFQFDLALPYPIADNFSTLGYVIGSVAVYVAVGY